MCGRYDLSETGRKLRIGDVELTLETTRSRYNIAPTQLAPVIRFRQGELFVRELKWGLIPGWAKDAKLGMQGINARSETAAEKPMFRTAFRKRRCVVPADGYFEWQTAEKRKLPWRFVRRDGGALLLAGLWEVWRPPSEPGQPEAPEVETFALLTTSPNAVASRVHDRMPVILDASGAERWLAPESEASVVQGLCVPAPDDLLTTYRVGTVVNSSRNDVPECVAREMGAATLEP